MTQMALDFTRSRALKEQGMVIALEHAGETWTDRAVEALKRYAESHAEFTVERFRWQWLADGGEPPPSPKVWGAVTNAAARRGFIKRTGRFVAAQSEKTHGHFVATWTKGDPHE